MDVMDFRSPYAKGSVGGLLGKQLQQQHGDLSESESDISFISSNRPSGDRISATLYDSFESGRTSRISTSSDSSYNGSEMQSTRGSELSSIHDQFSSSSLESVSISFISIAQIIMYSSIFTLLYVTVSYRYISNDKI